eukprot:15451033-Alexandrium_andersonii.AAC.1
MQKPCCVSDSTMRNMVGNAYSTFAFAPVLMMAVAGQGTLAILSDEKPYLFTDLMEEGSAGNSESESARGSEDSEVD